MKISAFLTINSRGALRVTKNTPSLYADEISVKLVVDVPDAVFRRPIPTLGIEVPENVVLNPDAELIARWVAVDVAEAMKLKVEDVRDGLVELIKEREEKAKA